MSEREMISRSHPENEAIRRETVKWQQRENGTLRAENEKLREALSEAGAHLEYAYMITFRDRLRDAAIAARAAAAAIKESGDEL